MGCSYGGGGGYANEDDDDLQGAARHANQHAGSSGDANMFSNVLSMIGQNKQSIGNQNIDEQGEFLLRGLEEEAYFSRRRQFPSTDVRWRWLRSTGQLQING